MDPWASEEQDRHFRALVLMTADFLLPPGMAFDGLRKAECLVGRDADDKVNMALLL